MEKSLAFRRLREVLLHSVAGLKEKLNPRISYVGYRTESSDRAYIYVQPDVLVIDVRRPRTGDAKLKNAGIEPAIYCFNTKGERDGRLEFVYCTTHQNIKSNSSQMKSS